MRFDDRFARDKQRAGWGATCRNAALRYRHSTNAMEGSMADETTARPGLTRRGVLAAGAGAGAAALATRLGTGAAWADTYPSEEIRWIIYQSPGGLIDGSTRAAQPYLKQAGFASRIEYVRGASGRIARTQLYRSKPDGYTLMTEASPEEVLGEVVYNA
jgi:hypothetical protein